MREHHLDVLFLTETRSQSYYTYLSEQHLVILSGNHFDRNAGVGAIVHPKIRPYLLDIIQVNPRILQLSFKKQGGNVHMIGAYAPHAGLDFEEFREPFWDTLEQHLSKIPQPEPIYLTGDFNVRFQARHKHDQGVTGPFTYGKGSRYIDHNASSNRSLCVKTMLLQNMVEVASYRTPNPMHHITFRDKAAPPKDWSQFVLDPLILQQIYSKMHFEFGDDALALAALTRSYLTLPDPLEAPKILPQPDPVRFQRLDHCFTRRQWLNTVCSCRSKLYTGFPSDHYLLVTEVKIRLLARRPQPPKRVRFDFKHVTEDQKTAFNASFRGALGGTQTTTHILPIIPKEGTFFTDGSGSSGKCTRHTPAGWGWCTREGGRWREAYGPVVTDPDHSAYRGAGVGSNNTGEVTAIIEAMLFAINEGYTAANLCTDSRWALNVITGRWHAKRNKELVKQARALYKHTGTHFRINWIKAHAGHEGNEKADQLANKGRESTSRHGTEAASIPALDEARIASEILPVARAIKTATEDTFCPKTTTRSRPWITDATLEALAKARLAEASQDHNAKQLRNQAKRSARRDRINWVHDRLLQGQDRESSAFWKVVRSQRRGFRAKKNHLIVNGLPVPWSQSHVAFRDHLQNQQWANQVAEEKLTELRNRPPLFATHDSDDPFSEQELEEAISKVKSNKAPGPDHNANEVFRLLDGESRITLLGYYSQVWQAGEAPEEWKEALVVSIYKGKGSDTDPANYRPISLLNTIYKIFAAMLQARLARIHDGNLRSTQYGFRSQRSTAHPLFILRRAMEWSDQTATPLYLLFLDWKQAFDSVDHNAMLAGLRRFGLSQASLKLIHTLYTDASFYTEGPLGEKVQGRVGSGIRQGCPLSPYLFIIVLTVLLQDVETQLLQNGTPTNTWSTMRPTFDLEYADDTLLLSLTTTQLQSFLSALESQADYYGMKLNQTKTEILVRSGSDPPNVRFSNGSLVPTTTQIKYLGSMISWENTFSQALKHRAALAEAAYKQLRLVWNSTMPRKKKLYIFQSVFLSTLVYGLDALTLTSKHMQKINGVYFRFLRRILGIKASYYSRVSNHEVWRKANYPRRPSDRLSKLQYKMMSEVFNSPMEDPLHNVVFNAAYRDRIVIKGRHRGRKRPYWLETTAQMHFPTKWAQYSGRTHLGRFTVYAEINRDLRSTGQAPMRAPERARR